MLPAQQISVFGSILIMRLVLTGGIHEMLVNRAEMVVRRDCVYHPMGVGDAQDGGTWIRQARDAGFPTRKISTLRVSIGNGVEVWLGTRAQRA
jgi:hypothetical protein